MKCIALYSTKHFFLMLLRMRQFCFLVVFFKVVNFYKGMALCEDVPEPVGLFPLNALHTTKDISNSYLTAGTAVGVDLAPGPDGKSGGSYYFPGSAYSYIEIPKQKKLDTRYSLTVLVWIYNQDTEGPILIYDTETIDRAIHMYISYGLRTFFFRIMKRNDLAYLDFLKYDLHTINKWRYVGYTYDYSTGYQALYVDGIKVQQGFVGKQEIASDYKIKIGGISPEDNRAFKGRISCVQIYDKALTPAQVQAVKHICVEKNDIYSACFQYTVINDPTRALEYQVSVQSSDRHAFKSLMWYRLKGQAGTRISTSCPPAGSCGAQSPGWLNSQYPSLEAGIKRMEICYRTGSDCCASNATAYVRQCYGYSVFMLDDVPDINLGNRICSETGPEFLFENVMFQATSNRCLSGHVMYSEIKVTDTTACVGYCLNAGSRCKSCNFIKLENGTCQLNNATLIDYPLHVTVNSSCKYYQRITVMSYIIP